MLWSISFGCQQNENLSWLGSYHSHIIYKYKMHWDKDGEGRKQGAAVLLEERTMVQGGD